MLPFNFGFPEAVCIGVAVVLVAGVAAITILLIRTRQPHVPVASFCVRCKRCGAEYQVRPESMRTSFPCRCGELVNPSQNTG